MVSNHSTPETQGGNPGNPITDVEPASVDVQPEYAAGGVSLEVVDRDGKGFRTILDIDVALQTVIARRRRYRAPARVGYTMSTLLTDDAVRVIRDALLTALQASGGDLEEDEADIGQISERTTLIEGKLREAIRLLDEATART